MASEHSFDHTNASEDLDKAFSGMLEGGGRSAKAKQKKKNKAGGKSKNADSEVATKEKKKGAKEEKRPQADNEKAVGGDFIAFDRCDWSGKHYRRGPYGCAYAA